MALNRQIGQAGIPEMAFLGVLGVLAVQNRF
jgi:hypothetical protein